MNIFFKFIFIIILLFSLTRINGQSVKVSEYSNSRNFFIENKGQIIDQKGIQNTRVNYLLNTPGLNVQLRNSGFSYDVYTKESKKSEHNLKGRKKTKDETSINEDRYRFHRIDIDFIDVNPTVLLIPKKEIISRINYFGSNNEKGVVGVKSYEKVVYQNLYDYIDLEFFIPTNKKKPVEYNFIVHPKGKLSDIKMKISGAEVHNKKTHLEFDVLMGVMNETIPSSWVDKNQRKKEVLIEYHSLGNNTYGFMIDNLNLSKGAKLVIDPTPVRLWATYFGGEEDETQYDADIETDSNGNIFTSGYTRSVTNIATAGSFETNYGSSWNGYLAKFNSDGVLLWSTYYGDYRTLFRGISIDSNDNIVGVGETYSDNNMSTAGSHQATLYDNGTENFFDGFIVKFGTDGNRIWGSYYGGESFDYCTSVSIDSNNNILVGGHTASNENIASAGAFSEHVTLNVHNNWDAFLVKLDEDGQRIWATYYSGQYSTGVDVDSHGSVYLLGQVNITDENISTSGAYQEEYSDEGSFSWSDTFLVKFDMNGNREWGTYFGGDSYDDSFAVVVDNLDNVIICGATRSNVFPTTPNAHQTSKGGEFYDYNGFLAKFDSSGAIQWNTLYGGSEGAEAYNIDIDSNNDIFLVGGSASPDAIATSDSFQPTITGGLEAFVAKFDALGTRLWGTYYGGTSSDTGLDIEVSSLGDLYLLGFTYGSTNLATPGSHQDSYSGNIDNFIVKFKDCLSSIVATVNTNLCEGDLLEFNASGGISYLWTGPNGFTSADANIQIPNASSTMSGTYNVSIISADGCNDTRTFEVLVSSVPVSSVLPSIVACADINTAGYASTFNTSQVQTLALNGQTNVEVSYFDGNGVQLPSPLPNPMSNSIQDLESITVRLTSQFNPQCYIESSFDLVVNPLPIVNAVQPITRCDDDISDGFTIFDLSGVEDIILDGLTGMSVSFFTQNGNPVPNSSLSSYTNEIAYQESILAVVADVDTNCTREVTFNLVVSQLPMANPVNNLLGCDDNNDGISNTFDTSMVIDQVLGSQQGMEVLFFDSNGGVLPSPLPNPYTNTVLNQEFITVRVLNPLTQCYAETLLELRTTSQPIINQPSDLYACNEGGGIGIFDTSNIENQIINSQSGLRVLYFDENNNALPSPLPTLFQNTIANQETIFVRVEDISNNLCYNETSFNLIVNELPQVTIEETYLICALEPSVTVTLPSGFSSYEWRFEDGTIISNTNEGIIANEGNYVLTIEENTNGIICTNSFTFELVRSDLPTITSVNVGDLGNNFIEVIASGDGDFEYSINGIDYQDSNVFQNMPGGVHTVHVRDRYNCGEDSQEVVLVDYPPFFTPNSDGIKDYWQIEGISHFPEAKIFIYNRYGKLLRILDANSLGWDGIYNRRIMPPNDYWFRVDLGNGRRFNGHFSLLR